MKKYLFHLFLAFTNLSSYLTYGQIEGIKTMNIPISKSHLSTDKAPIFSEGLGSNHRHEFNWNLFEVGFPLMPKMNNYFAFPLFSGVGYTYKPTPPSPFKFKPHLHFQIFANVAGYNFSSWYSGTEVNHTMVFDNGEKTDIKINYTNFISQYGIGLKFNFSEKSFNNGNRFVRTFLEGNIGLVHLRTRMLIPDPESGWDDCVPLVFDQMINKYTGGIFRTGLGFEIGGYNQNAFLFFKIGYVGSFKPVEYANQNFLDLEPRHSIDHKNHSTHKHQTGARDVYVDFINVFNSDVHAHKVSEIYRSPLRFIYLNFGATFTFPQ